MTAISRRARRTRARPARPALHASLLSSKPVRSPPGSPQRRGIQFAPFVHRSKPKTRSRTHHCDRQKTKKKTVSKRSSQGGGALTQDCPASPCRSAVARARMLALSKPHISNTLLTRGIMRVELPREQVNKSPPHPVDTNETSRTRANMHAYVSYFFVRQIKRNTLPCPQWRGPTNPRAELICRTQAAAQQSPPRDNSYSDKTPQYDYKRLVPK